MDQQKHKQGNQGKQQGKDDAQQNRSRQQVPFDQENQHNDLRNQNSDAQAFGKNNPANEDADDEPARGGSFEMFVDEQETEQQGPAGEDPGRVVSRGHDAGGSTNAGGMAGKQPGRGNRSQREAQPVEGEDADFGQGYGNDVGMPTKGTIKAERERDSHDQNLQSKQQNRGRENERNPGSQMPPNKGGGTSGQGNRGNR